MPEQAEVLSIFSPDVHTITTPGKALRYWGICIGALLGLSGLAYTFRFNEPYFVRQTFDIRDQPEKDENM